jgi:hypothetical protein
MRPDPRWQRCVKVRNRKAMGKPREVKCQPKS